MRRITGSLVVGSMLTSSLAAAVVTSVVTATPAAAAVVDVKPVLSAGSNGIALGPDGNLWVAEQFNSSVAKVSPTGVVLQRIPMTGPPIGVSGGPSGTVWVTVPEDDKVVRIVAATGAVTDVSTNAGPACGPVAVADGGDGRIYLSLPNDGGGCVGASALATVNVADNVVSSPQTGRGTAYDLAVAGGKLYVPDYDADAVRRVALGVSLTVETAIGIAGGSGPSGVTVLNGEVYTTLQGTGGVTHFPVTQNGGTTVTFPGPVGISGPIGITPDANGQLVVAAGNSIYDLSTTGVFTAVPVPALSKPQNAVLAANGDVWVTDANKPQLLRVVDGPPKGAVTTSTATSASTASVVASVDPRGNATQFHVDYGTTTAYGSTVAGSVAAGASPLDQTVTLSKLKPGKTYHLRLTATNVRGTFVGTDTTFTMPKQVKAKSAFTWTLSASSTVLTTVKLTKLTGGETVTLTCAGGKSKGCPFKKKTIKKLKKGTKDLSALFKGRQLKPGAKLVVTVSAKDLIDRTTTLTVRQGKPPKISRG